MKTFKNILSGPDRLVLRDLPISSRVLVTCTILVFSLAMSGAMGQIIVHDIIPTFFASAEHGGDQMVVPNTSLTDERDDLFNQENNDRNDIFDSGETPAPSKTHKSILDDEQFIWTLKWTHIHLFGMNMIFILMGPITVLLNLSENKRAWLVGLPFAGVIIDISALWLKNFVSPAFFWLHMPGGLMFGSVFGFVALRALWEMWGPIESHGCC